MIQLQKACRLLDACRLIRTHDGYHTSVVEMSFAAIERTLEFYALTASNDSINDFREGHELDWGLGTRTVTLARREETPVETVVGDNSGTYATPVWVAIPTEL